MRTRNYRVSVLDDVGDQFAEPGSAPWAKWFLGQAKLRRSDLDRDVIGLQEIMKKLVNRRAWEVLGFDSLRSLCKSELSLDEDEAESIIAAKPGMTLRAVLAAEAGKPSPEHGEIGRGRDRDDNINSNSTTGGTSADYLTARIARDRPDILDRMKAGEFRSVRAAAIEAGIVKVATPYEQTTKLLAKLSKADKRRLYRALADELEADDA